jgi:O-methyltransferase
MNRKFIEFIKKFIPEYFLVIVRAIFFPGRLVLLSPTYNNDGLATFHVVDFMHDERFINAIKDGKKYTENRQDDFRIYIGCALADHAQKLDGDFVECGVWLGVMSKSIINYIDFDSLKKKFWLFDTFQGIPKENMIENDGREFNFYDNKGLHGKNNIIDKEKIKIIDLVIEKFSKNNVEIVEGIVPEALEIAKNVKVAFLHIDMNNAYPEVEAIKFFWKKIVTSGVILLDDYAYSPEYKIQKESIDELGEKIGFSVITLPTGQGLIIKP